MQFEHKDFISFNQSIEQYKLIELINQGGMGCIYLAEDTRLKRHVAIKLFKTEQADSLNQENKTLTLQEAQLLARLNHPNIVQIHDVLLFDEFVCIVMEYLKGKTLQQFQQQHVITLTQKLTILADICAGLLHAHNQGVLHCDLKASNVLIDQQHTKITDFGISQLTIDKPEKRATGQSSYGSLTVMSPEQLKNEPLTVKSDLFSFGLLAFELIVGHHPFGKGSPQSIANSIVEHHAEDALQLIPKLPTELALLLNQLLEQDLNKRPSGTEKVHQQLQAIIVALTQQTILDQETHEFTPVINKQKSWFSNKWLQSSLACFFIASIGTYSYFHLSEPKNRHVALLTPLIQLDESTVVDEDLLKATIDEAVRQGIINNKQLDLISHSEVNAITPNIDIDNLSKDTLNTIRAATGAEEIITAHLTCELKQCSLALERLDSPNWTVNTRKQWPVVTDNVSYLYNSTGQQLETLFPDFKDRHLALSEVDENTLQEHLNLYQDVILSENYTREAFEQIEKLIAQAPNLYANYDILREVTLGVYADSQNEADLTKAQKMLFNAPLNYQTTPSFNHNAAMLAIAGHKWEQAESYIAKARQVGTALYTIHELEGSLYFEQDDLEKAQQAFELALKLRPNNVTKELLATVLWWQGYIEESKIILNEILSINPDNYIANQLLADIAMFEGNLDLAINKYSKAINILPTGADLSYLSIAYSLQGRFDEAYKVAKESVNLNSENEIYLLNLADIQKALNLKQESTENYNKVISLSGKSESFDNLLNIAQAYSQLEKPKEALKALNSAITISPNDKEYIFTAALVYSLIEEYQSALIYIEKSIESGYHPMWFKLPWFNKLCNNKEFVNIVYKQNSSVGCNKQVF